MNFIVDAQLPFSIAKLLEDNGHNAIHTSQLPKKNFTDDLTIAKLSISEERIVITKDSDFYHSFVLKREPYKLLLIRVGNMRKGDLLKLFTVNLSKLLTSLNHGDLVELSRDEIKILY
jgi:predicted nuclease of predicted toxin-antitoxin system